MDIVEYAENVIGLKLLDFQKLYLIRLHDIYKKDPESFNKYYHSCRRYTPFNPIPLFVAIFDLFNMFNKFNKEVEDET